MNVSEYLAELGDVLDDPASVEFPAEALMRHGDRQLRGLYRTLVQSNKQHSNCSICVQKEVANEPIDGVFDYRLPSWVLAVTRVWERNGSPLSQSTLSPYLWTVGGAQIGREIPKGVFGDKNGDLLRWSWDGSNTLRLSKTDQALELILNVTVRPPRMAKVKLATAPSGQAALYLPPTPTFGQYDLEEGSYINSTWQVTETKTTNAATYGESRRCIYSNAATIVASVRRHELKFDANWTSTLETDDIVETLVPLPDEHCRLLVLLAARACFQQKGNMKGLAAIQQELSEEGQKFMTYATPPRDTRGPTEYRRNTTHPTLNRITERYYP